MGSIEIQPVNIERDRHSAEKFRREIPTRPNVEKSSDEYILAAHQKEHTGNGNTVVGFLKQHGTCEAKIIADFFDDHFL